MRITVLIETADERFEVSLREDEIRARNANGAIVMELGLGKLWYRASRDAATWVEARLPKGDCG